jgi:hypothetical protein
MKLTWPPKTPDDILDYTIDWTGRLEAEVIAESRFSIPHGLVKLSEAYSATATKLWLAGGMAGEAYTIVNRVKTSGGRSLEQLVELSVLDFHRN